MCSTSATRPLLYSGLLGLSVARSTCFAAAGSEMTRKLDAGPATQHMVWQEQGHNRLHIRACAAPLWHVNARPVAPFRFKHMLVSQHHSVCATEAKLLRTSLLCGKTGDQHQRTAEDGPVGRR